MPKGGARPGAGRPKGAKGIKRLPKPMARAERVLTNGGPACQFKTSLEYAMAVINDPTADQEHKTRLAIAALPYQHAKLAERMPSKRADAQGAAERAAAGRLAPPAPPKLIVDNS